MMTVRKAHSRRLSWALGGSLAAMAAASASPASAQCAPDPTVANGTTNCTGTDSDGIRVTTSGTTLSVGQGAIVTNTGASAVTVDVPNTTYLPTKINVAGRVDGGTQSAVTLLTGPVVTNSVGITRLTLTVAEGGNVSGATALSMAQSAGNSSGQLVATIDNAGTMAGSSGIALRGDLAVTASGYTTSYSAYDSIRNRATGVISGSIVGPVASLNNEGLIDGGSGSALTMGNAGSSYPYTIGAGAWSNSGTIRSNSAAATIVSATINSLTNSGTIANSGSGAALSAASLDIRNQSSGVIGSGGPTAIVGSYVGLMNLGIVNGNVISGNFGSTIDSTAGVINGSVMFGNGNDTLIALYNGTSSLVTGVTGTIDGGGGINTERVIFAADTSVTTPINVHAGFQKLGLAVNANVTSTLEAGFTALMALELSGQGAVVNRGSISVAGPAVADLDYAFGSAGSFRNESSITSAISSGSNQYGLTLSSHSFINSGTLTVSGVGGGVSMSYNPVNNSGTITASGTGVNLFDGVLNNSGTIVSTAGAGVNLFGNVGYTGSNSGTIRGATTGAITNIYLTNTGTISSSGVGVTVQPYGYLINAAGGVVNGGSGGAATVSAFNGGIANAGTINGDVIFNGIGVGSNLAYFALAGGTLNGNLKLGGGVTFVADLASAGPGQFPGVTGTVTSDGTATLRYAVSSDAGAVLPVTGVGPFSDVSYQLSNDAKLTLSAPAAQIRTRTLQLAGKGSVDLDATITVTGQPAVQSISAITYPGNPVGVGKLSITNRGAISVTREIGSNGNYFAQGVSLADADTFLNLGTITVTDRNSSSYVAGIGLYTSLGANSGTITNAGSILLDGGIGINSGKIVNTGTITQIAGGAVARGVAGSFSLDNQGTISVGGTAVTAYNNSAIVNSGTITSTGGIAIGGSDTLASATITNASGATISGTGGTAVRLYYGSFTNAGTVNGTVDMGYYVPYYPGAPARSSANSTFVAAGGTIAGDLLFGAGADLLLQTGDSIGVSGTVDGGAGANIYGRSLSASATVAIDPAGIVNFQNGLVQAIGADTVATTTGTLVGNLYLTGTGSIINQAAIKGALTTSVPFFLNSGYSASPYFPLGQVASSVTNAASIAGGAYLTTPSFINTGTITSPDTNTSYGSGQAAVTQFAATALSFENSGTIAGKGSMSPYYAVPAVQINGDLSVNFTNSGTISAPENSPTYSSAVTIAAGGNAVISNSGQISGSGLSVIAGQTDDGSSPSVDVTNTGTISSGNGIAALDLGVGYGRIDASANVANSGTISAQGSVTSVTGVAIGLSLRGNASYGTVANNVAGTITNNAGGTISASGTYAYAVLANSASLDLVNDGTISASGTSASFAIAVNSNDLGSTIRNTGTISGAIRLGGGDDLIENRGLIDGDVFLGAGNDRFLQLAGSVTGTVDGGTGLDTLTIDTAQSGTIDASRFVNFERFTQAGSGNATYTGAFNAQSFGVSGGILTVAEGASLTSSDAVTITGSASGEQVTNAGTISGSVDLGGGNDTVVNRGTIGGAVALGDGDDSFTETTTGSVGGPVDGGAGTDTYVVELAGDRSGIGARRNFEILGITGAGTLALTLDQSWQQVALAGTNLNLILGGFTVGSLTGGAASEQVTVDGDLANVALGGGDDRLTLSAASLAGIYDGGAGANTLRTTASGPITLGGTVSNFGLLDFGSGPLAISGSLTGAAGGTLFAGTGHDVTIGRGAVIAGGLSLGAGANTLRILAGSTVGGTIAGGDGSGLTALQIVNDGGTFALGAALSGFDIATLTGGGTVQVNGAWTVGALSFDGNLAVGATGSIAATSFTGSAGANVLTLGAGSSGSIDLGAGNDTLRLTGAFTPRGTVSGGAGTDTLELAVSGTGDAPTNLGATSFTSFERLRAISGVAIMGGTQSFANGVEVGAGARLIGAAGSVFTAPSFNVAAGGTFGTAGTVNGNIAVAGTLSPGASPGTMTVNGNVALAAGSNTLFELTTPVSDQLLVSGALTIASGSTLTLTGTRPLTPGVTLDLIVANGGITGSFSTVNQTAGVGGFLSQSANRISLLGTFLTSSGFSPQVNRAIDGVNGLLISGKANAAVLAGVPKLIVGGAADAAAFVRISPEPFAAAATLALEDGLSLIDATRNQARSATTTTGLYSFAQGIGTRYRVRGEAGQGINSARLSSTGGFAGLGFGAEVASVGVFVGYGRSSQSIGALGSSLHGDGVIAGVQASANFAGISVAAVGAYSDRDTRLSRATPQGGSQSNFHLRDTLGDLTASYSLPLAPGWAIKPRVGVSYVHVQRGKAAETGSSPFTLQLASAGTSSWFVDGGIDLAGAAGPLRPFVGVAVRQRLSGRQNDVDAAFTGTSAQITALGASSGRTSILGSAGASLDLTSKLSLSAGYTGAFSHTTRHSGTIGLRYIM